MEAGEAVCVVAVRPSLRAMFSRSAPEWGERPYVVFPGLSGVAFLCMNSGESGTR